MIFTVKFIKQLKLMIVIIMNIIFNKIYIMEEQINYHSDYAIYSVINAMK